MSRVTPTTHGQADGDGLSGTYWPPNEVVS
jgi:hypothetical protein